MIISKEKIEEVASQDNVVVIDLVNGAFSPPRYVEELWLWGLGATKYERTAAKKRLFSRWMAIAEKTDLLNKIEKKTVYIATLNGDETIYAKFFKKFLQYLKKKDHQE